MSKRKLTLTEKHRRHIFHKTGGRCHFCGDRLTFDKRGKWHGPDSGAWEADHIAQLGRSEDAGRDTLDNYLPACSACNGLRWNRDGGDIRRVMRVGLEGLSQIKRGTDLGKELEKAVEARLRRNSRRRKYHKLKTSDS